MISGLTVRDEQNPEGDIEIAVTGLRPGEKLYEELLIGDNPKPTMHPRIMTAHEDFVPWAEFEAKLNALEMALNVNDVSVIRLMMQQLVVGYIPSDGIVDWVYLEQEAEALGGRLNLVRSALSAGKCIAKASAPRIGVQPANDKLSRSGWRLCVPREPLMTGDFLIGLGRTAQRSFLKCFRNLQPDCPS